MNLTNDVVVHKSKDGLEYIQFKKLLKYKDKISHAYGIGVDVNYRSVGKNKSNAMKSYDELCSSIGLNVNDLVKPCQNHTKKVKAVNDKEDGPIVENRLYRGTDGLVTNKPFTLATTNADCILLLFYDPKKNVIANTHSGWRGTLQRISIETVNEMKNEYGCNPEDIICCMCPSIRKCHFEVKKEVRDDFAKEFKDLGIEENKEIMEETNPGKKWNIDTILINKIILKQAGLKPENIIDSGLCSVCNSDILHSYRAEGEGYGLDTAIIGLKK